MYFSRIGFMKAIAARTPSCSPPTFCGAPETASYGIGSDANSQMFTPHRNFPCSKIPSNNFLSIFLSTRDGELYPGASRKKKASLVFLPHAFNDAMNARTSAFVLPTVCLSPSQKWAIYSSRSAASPSGGFSSIGHAISSSPSLALPSTARHRYPHCSSTFQP